MEAEVRHVRVMLLYGRVNKRFCVRNHYIADTVGAEDVSSFLLLRAIKYTAVVLESNLGTSAIIFHIALE